MSKTNQMLLVIGLVSSLIFFQNCGGFNSVDSINSGVSNPSQNEAELFKAGDAFDLTLIPYNVTPELQIELENYKNRTGLKVVVLTPNGEGLAGGNRTVTTQEELTKIYLKRCQLEFNNQPCAVFAEGDVIKYDEKEFYQSHKRVIEDQTVFDPLKVPTWSYKWRNESTYLTRANAFRAMAIGIKGAVHSGWSNVSQADANRRALEFCEVIVDHPCVLYAVNTDVVFKSDQVVWGPKIVEFGPSILDINKIPFVSDERIALTAVPLLNRMNTMNKKSVIALSRWGNWYHIESNNSITQANIDLALANCTALITPVNDPTRYQPICFVYSIDNNVVVTKESFRLASFGN